MCETHAPLGNLRKKSFWEIWGSPEAQRLRESIAHRECYCTNEVFLWPSIVYQPPRLLQTMVGARVWKKAEALRSEEKVAGTSGEVAAGKGSHVSTPLSGEKPGGTNGDAAQGAAEEQGQATAGETTVTEATL